MWPSVKGRLRSRQTKASTCLALLLGAGIGIGYAPYTRYEEVATTLCVVSLVPFFMYCRAANIEFGPNEWLPEQLRFHMRILFMFCIVCTIPYVVSMGLFESHSPTVAFLLKTLGYLLMAGMLSIGGFSLYANGGLALLARGASPWIFEEEIPAHMHWLGFYLGGLCFLTLAVRYRRDQTIIGSVVMLLAAAIDTGSEIARGSRAMVAMIVLCCFCAYVQTVWIRRKRRLPPNLEGCKFISLAYLRELAATKEGIQRRQQLPESAFGDPRKAKYLLIVSHRWLNRYTCDVQSDEYPEGFRLRKMLAKLDRFFTMRHLRRSMKGQSWSRCFSRIQMGLTSGVDVLVFFDFMSLPQEGLSNEGMTIQRTVSEKMIFDKCLPNMGSLYSMFPVLVCEEVGEGALPYLASGWCFTEVTTAWLGNQLDTFSADCRAGDWFKEVENHDLDMSDMLEHQLNKKHFLQEHDRNTVKHIIKGFLKKRRLVEAIKAKDPDILNECLADIRAIWKGFLDQPIDSKLNTPLHLAVQVNFVRGVKLLLDSGANRRIRNHAGDMPAEIFMLPRFSKAAQLCRRYEPRLSSKDTACSSFGGESRTMSDEGAKIDLDPRFWDSEYDDLVQPYPNTKVTLLTSSVTTDCSSPPEAFERREDSKGGPTLTTCLEANFPEENAAIVAL